MLHRGSMTTSGSIDALLARIADDPAARREAFAAVYGALRTRASGLLGRGGPRTLNTTALVHEAFLKLVDQPLAVEGRAHFFNLAAHAMRQILVDHQRQRSRIKRDPGEIVSLSAGLAQAEDHLPLFDLLALHEAMERLRQRSDRLADVVQLRFFAGLEFAQIAELLGVSLSSVTRDWRSAKALLYVDMREAVSDVQPE